MVLLVLFLALFFNTTSGFSTCIHDTQSDNNGVCKPDYTENPDGTIIVHAYNCEVNGPEREGYPPIHNCVIGEADGTPDNQIVPSNFN